ncbi:MAG: prenyltransferase/squalene oxidase repeat-containing protein [Anaerolineae bacterium]
MQYLGHPSEPYMRTIRRIQHLALVVLVLSLCLASTVSAGAPEALSWLRGQQAPDGGFGQPSSVGATIDAALAITAGGGDLTSWQMGGNTPLDFLRSNLSQIEGAGVTAKLMLALVPAGLDPTNFGGANLAKVLEDSYDSATGQFDGENGTVPTQALAIMALESIGRPVEKKAINWLVDAQADDGSWSWNGDPATQGDTNTTAISIQALVAVNARPDVVDGALEYLKRVQNEDAGWPYQKPSDFGTDMDANSTANVLQALYATGADLSDWSVDSTSPLDTLLSLQKGNGAFQWQATVPDDNFLATVQAVPALVGKAFPLTVLSGSVVAPNKLPATGGQAAPWPAVLFTLAALTMVLAGVLRRRLMA